MSTNDETDEAHERANSTGASRRAPFAFWRMKRLDELLHGAGA